MAEAQPSSPLGQTVERKVNILLVDDNAANRLSVLSVLNVLGHNIVEAASGEGKWWTNQYWDEAAR